MPKDYFIQPDVPDPVLSDATVLELARQHAPRAQAVTRVDEEGGEARTYHIDDDLLLKVQRPHRLRPRTSLKREVFFLNRLAGIEGISVPRVLGYGHPESLVEYTLMTRMPGIAIEFADLNGPARRQALFDLGCMLRRIHSLPQAAFVESRLFPGDQSPVDVYWRFGNLFDEAVELVHAQRTPHEWTFALPPQAVARAAMRLLPDADGCVALHSNPGPEHVFVDAVSGRLTGSIDFGDAYISHPVHDLRRWRCPQDRQDIWDGYVSGAPVNESFQQTWRVACALTDMLAIARAPHCRKAAVEELSRILKQ